MCNRTCSLRQLVCTPYPDLFEAGCSNNSRMELITELTNARAINSGAHTCVLMVASNLEGMLVKKHRYSGAREARVEVIHNDALFGSGMAQEHCMPDGDIAGLHTDSECSPGCQYARSQHPSGTNAA
jgi:hypothetical protein